MSRFFSIDIRDIAYDSLYRLPTYRRDAHRNFFNDPLILFKIEILVKRPISG